MAGDHDDPTATSSAGSAANKRKTDGKGSAAGPAAAASAASRPSLEEEIRRLRHIKGVGCPDDLRVSGDGSSKAGALNDYTLTIEAIIGDGGDDGDDLIRFQDGASVNDNLHRVPGMNMFTWTGPMGADCVRAPTSGPFRLKWTDLPEGGVSEDDFVFEHLRMYVTSPSKDRTYKLFEFDEMKTTCTLNSMMMLGFGGEECTTTYNEYRDWCLPNKHKCPKSGIQLVVSIKLGAPRSQMIQLEWYSGRDRLEEEHVLAYLNGEEIGELED